MTDSQDDSGVDLYGVAVDPAAYAESAPSLYVYRQARDGATYTGIVCDVAVEAIADNRIRGHEAVHQLRVDALVWHHARSDGPPALAMLLHREGPTFVRALAEAQASEPLLDFAGPEGYRQTVWRIEDAATTHALAEELSATELYIADGHHRTAAALEEWRVAGKPREAGLLCLVLAMDGLSLSAFHRRVSGPVDREGLLALVSEGFAVRECDAVPEPTVGTVGLYVDRRWYALDLTAPRPPGVDGLDATLLQTWVLDRLPPAPPGRVRTVDSFPASTALAELVARCDVDRGALFTLAPPPPESLTEVADAGQVMPPKTTFFEPKPAAGIFLRR